MKTATIDTANMATTGTIRLIRSVRDMDASDGITAANTTMLMNPFSFPFSRISFGTMPSAVTITPITRHTIE